MDHGIRIFRVDNPHTKPLPFWERLLAEVDRTDPDVIFLAAPVRQNIALLPGLARTVSRATIITDVGSTKRDIVGAAAVLPAHVGLAVARDLLLSARRFDAAEAQRIGVISRLVPHEELRDAALQAVGEILQTPPMARMHVKRMLNERYGLIDYQTMFWALAESPEPREGNSHSCRGATEQGSGGANPPRSPAPPLPCIFFLRVFAPSPLCVKNHQP